MSHSKALTPPHFLPSLHHYIQFFPLFACFPTSSAAMFEIGCCSNRDHE